MDQITKNTLSTVEPMLRRLGDKSIETSVQINKLTDTLKSETKENEKPSKKKKKEAIEATGAASAGATGATATRIVAGPSVDYGLIDDFCLIAMFSIKLTTT